MFLSTTCEISEPLYENNNKKYLILKLDPNDVLHVRELHDKMKEQLTLPRVDIPLNGDCLKVKVPFRYNRICCKLEGDKIIQEMKKGDIVNVKIVCCGPWFYKPSFCGIAWKLEYISLSE